jgi:DNA-directed RNA polymerase subunit alpha
MVKKKVSEPEPEILFTREDLEIEDICALKDAVNSAFKLRRQLEKATEDIDEDKAGKLSSKQKMRARKGMAYWILNKPQRAFKLLEDAGRSKVNNYFLARVYLDLDKYDSAHELLESSYREDPHAKPVFCALIEAKIKKGLSEEALALLQKSKKDFREDPAIHYYLGWCLEGLGQYREMIKEYEAALRINERHAPSLFRLAYNLERMGEDEQAIELYEKLKTLRPLHVNALVNLGLLYEDKGAYPSAAECYSLILKYYPGHPRAQLFSKDTTASLVMFYDEEQKHREEQLRRLLNTPLSDFHLSVRSRAALNKLRIGTIGDLAGKTENELLKLDNFGMTSLAEVKELLARKGLGLAHEQAGSVSLEPWEMASPGVDPAKTTDLLNRSIFTFDWSSRSRKCLERLKLYTVGDLVNKTEADFLNTRNFGRTSLNEIKQRLNSLGLGLKTGVS